MSRIPFGGRGDPLPTSPITVLLASSAAPFRPQTVKLAIRLARGGAVGVLTVARVHGSGFGLPNPGLLPTPKERQEAVARVESAIRSLHRAGLQADGEVAVTRYPARRISRAARSRGAAHVVVEPEVRSALRAFLEGDVVRAVRRRLRGHAEVSVAE
jgi:Universal stress protein family